MNDDALHAFFHSQLAEHRLALESTTQSAFGGFAAVLRIWTSCIGSGGKLLLFGNGGSAADAQHLAAELVVRYRNTRRALPAVALTADTAVLSACANDFGYECVFARQVEALGRPGDVAVALSTSGRSENVMNALRAARALQLRTTGFTGDQGTALIKLCDASIVIPSRSTARIQELHITLGHMLCAAIESEACRN